jgi:hypothetical protein
MSAPTYEWVELPVGPQEIPSWIKGARVNWSEGYANAPDIELLTTPHPNDWEGKRWRRHGDSLYASVSADGRGDFLSARGEPKLQWLPERLPYAIPVQKPRSKFLGSTFWGLRRVWATPQSEGFAGRHFEIVMENGVSLILRGPWFGGVLPGYVQTSWHEAGARQYRNRGKWDTMGYFGLFITEDLWLKVLARYAPECRCARVTQYGRSRLQPVRGDWDEPKHWVDERARADRREVAA